jgi:hypothetical protein
LRACGWQSSFHFFCSWAGARDFIPASRQDGLAVALFYQGIPGGSMRVARRD